MEAVDYLYCRAPIPSLIARRFFPDTDIVAFQEKCPVLGIGKASANRNLFRSFKLKARIFRLLPVTKLIVAPGIKLAVISGFAQRIILRVTAHESRAFKTVKYAFGIAFTLLTAGFLRQLPLPSGTRLLPLDIIAKAALSCAVYYFKNAYRYAVLFQLLHIYKADCRLRRSGISEHGMKQRQHDGNAQKHSAQPFCACFKLFHISALLSRF